MFCKIKSVALKLRILSCLPLLHLFGKYGKNGSKLWEYVPVCYICARLLYITVVNNITVVNVKSHYIDLTD